MVFHFSHSTIPSIASSKEFDRRSTHLPLIKIIDLRNLTATYHFSWDHVFLKKVNLRILLSAIGCLEKEKKRKSAAKMGMTRGHSIAAISIGTLQLLFSVALIIPSFVLSSYNNQHVNTSMTPYWTGFPVSVERFCFRLLANLWCR